MKVTKIKIDKYVFWVEPRFVFFNKEMYFWRELADGGIVSYNVDMDNEPCLVKFWAPNNPILLKLRTILMEKQLGLTTDET